MSRVDWALLCDLAYFDAYRNLCVIGMQTQPVPSFPVGTRRFAIAARVPGLAPRPMVSVSLSTPRDAVAPTTCEHLRVETIGDHLVLTVGVAPLIDQGVYRVEVTVPLQPSIAIDLPIVIGDCERDVQLLPDRHHIHTTGAELPLRGTNHVGLG